MLESELNDQPRPTLDELLLRARRGDRSAFDAMVLRVEDDVFKTALYLVRNLDDAADVAQEVYVKLITKSGGLKHWSNPRGWIHRVTVNAARDLIRKRRLWLPVTASLRWFRPADPVQSEELANRLAGAMADLSFRERAAFTLRELQEIDTAEVARIMGCRPTTVRGYVHAARQKLQEHFPEYGRES